MSKDLSPAEMSQDALLAQDTDVEYALILSQMIEVAEADPSQLRLAIYEFARAKLINNTFSQPADERRRLAQSLETAIAGVEKFAEKRDNLQRMVFRHGGAALSDASDVDARRLLLQSGMSPPVITPIPAAEEPIRIDETEPKPDLSWPARQLAASGPRRMAIVGGLAVAVLAVAAIVWTQQLSRQSERINASAAAPIRKNGADAVAATAARPEGTQAPRAEQAFPLPADYGTYLISGANLKELEPIETAVPDRRIEMSTPINRVHQVATADGSPKFLVYRRDLANDPPQKVEVRVLARVGRVTNFDARGKPTFSKPAAMYIIRNVAFELRVRPVPERPEMLLIQAREGEAPLPAGRYVLNLKDKGYDFVVPGEVTEPAQCVERTEASNGSFYGACQ